MQNVTRTTQVPSTQRLKDALQARGLDGQKINKTVQRARGEGKSPRISRDRLEKALSKSGLDMTAPGSDLETIYNEACGVTAQTTATVNTETRRADEAGTGDQGGGTGALEAPEAGADQATGESVAEPEPAGDQAEATSAIA